MITEFRGQYRFLSNFYTCPVAFEDVMYPSSEHAFQAAKTLDLAVRNQISKIEKAGDTKRAGKTVVLRPDWEMVKVRVMEEIVLMKFKNNINIQKKLLATKDETLIEGNNWHDTFWGVCNGVGLNYLGKILMTTRYLIWRDLEISSRCKN
jgi:N-glycosidase YbiA